MTTATIRDDVEMLLPFIIMKITMIAHIGFKFENDHAMLKRQNSCEMKQPE